MGGDDRQRAERQRATHDGADITRIGQLVEQQQPHRSAIKLGNAVFQIHGLQRPDGGQHDESGKSRAQEPPPSFAELIAAGTVVPDQLEGPYVLASYHANITGAHRGFKDKESFDEWIAINEAIMAQQTSWATIDFEAENAVDPVYMFNYGTIKGRGLQMSELRKVVIKAQKAMKKAYEKAYVKAYRKQGAAEVFQRIAKVPERRDWVHQPQPDGAQLDLIGLYKGALGALGELWKYGQQVVLESGEEGVAVSWSLKKARPR